MDKNMQDVTIFTNEGGGISIEQRSWESDEPWGTIHRIAISVEQLDIVSQWLNEAKKEILDRG